MNPHQLRPHPSLPALTFGQSALTSFYGIGPRHMQRLMSKLYIHETARVGSLADKQVLDLTAELSNMTIENDLRRKLQDNIRRLRDMGAYRGRRHAMHMPVRGQRTRTQVCKPIHHGLPVADMRQDCHRWEVEQSREIWLALGCIILQHLHWSARIISASGTTSQISSVNLQSNSTLRTQPSPILPDSLKAFSTWCNWICTLASVDLNALVLTCTDYAYIWIPEYPKYLDPITRNPRSASDTFPTNGIHALPHLTVLVRLGRSEVPYPTCPVMAPTSKSICVVWIYRQTDDGIGMSSQRHSHNFGCRGPGVNQRDMSSGCSCSHQVEIRYRDKR